MYFSCLYKYKYLLGLKKNINNYILLLAIILYIIIVSIHQKISIQNNFNENDLKCDKTILLESENSIKIWKTVYSNKVMNMCLQGFEKNIFVLM